MQVYVKNRPSFVGVESAVAVALAVEIEAAAEAVNVASGTVAERTVALLFHGWDTLTALTAPSDPKAVSGGIEAWRRNTWSKTVSQYWESVTGAKPSKAAAKLVRPVVSILGTAMFLGIGLTEGEHLKSFAKIREEVRERQGGADPVAMLVKAVESLAPAANGVVTVAYDTTHCSTAAAHLEAEQIVAFLQIAEALCVARGL